MSFLRSAKLAALTAGYHAGLLRLASRLSWRRNRLVVLCYHGISLKDEHRWRPGLYISPEEFRSRMALLRDMGLTVLSLSDGLVRLREGTLDKPSVVITFDDGFYDFYHHAAPILEEFKFPATLYLTTYYVDANRPLFNLIVPYMLWAKRGADVTIGPDLGLEKWYRLVEPEAAESAATALVDLAAERKMDSLAKFDFAAAIASQIGINWGELLEARLLQLVSKAETTDLSHRGFDIQLHTHRHRTPMDQSKFRREIVDNRVEIESMTMRRPTHFCYPSGVWDDAFHPWLLAEGVDSATTCDAGIATRDTNPLLVPRMLDVAGRSPAEFAAWVSGADALFRT